MQKILEFLNSDKFRLGTVIPLLLVFFVSLILQSLNIWSDISGPISTISGWIGFGALVLMFSALVKGN
jgi:hypothetical protein